MTELGDTLRLLWQLEHLRCEQTALHGGGDALFGNRGTGQPVFAETLGVEDEMSHNAKIVTFDNIRLHTFGLTMYCPGFTVTSLHTSLVLHAGSWDGMVYIFRLDLFYPFIYIWPFIVYSHLYSCYVPLSLCTFQCQKVIFEIWWFVAYTWFFIT